MLLIRCQDVDITQHYVSKSLSRKEQLNNRANTATMRIVDYRIQENQRVDIREYVTLVQPTSPTDTVLYVDQLYTDSNKFLPGMEIRLGDGIGTDVYATIASLDPDTNTIVLTGQIWVILARYTKILLRFWWGIVVNVSEDQYGKCGGYEYNVSLTDYKKLLDRENVQETFLNMYSRELFGRVLYFFCARDSELTLDDFQTSRTAWGVALPTVNENTERIQGTNSQKTGTSNLWVATRTKTVTAKDVTGYTHLRRWWKIATGNGSQMSSMKIRIWSSSSDYYEWPVTRIWSPYEDCRNYESVKRDKGFTIQGNPTLTAVTWLQIEMDVTNALPSGSILFDIMSVSTGGFTCTGTVRGGRKFEDVRIQHRKPSEVIEDLCKIQWDYRHVDYERDLIYYTKNGYENAPFSLTPTSPNYWSLGVEIDTSDLKNRQTVIWWESPEMIDYTQDEISDGKEESYRLDYKAKDLKIFVSTDDGDTFVPKTVWIENLVDASTVDFVTNFQEKIVKLWSHPKLNAWDVLRRVYYPFKPVSYRFADLTSVDAMKLVTGGNGYYDGSIIIDRTIETQSQAFLRAKAEVDLYKNPQITCDFITNQDNLKAGHLITIVDPNRNLNDQFLIQKIDSKEKASGYREHKVTATSSLYGIIEFFQLLLKKSARLYLNQEAIIYIVVNVDEVIRRQDQVMLTPLSNVFRAGDRFKKVRDFVYEKGTRSSNGAILPRGNLRDMSLNGWAVGSVNFFTSTRHNNGTSLRLSCTNTAPARSVVASHRIRFPLIPAMAYTMQTRISSSALTNLSGWSQIQLILDEYDAQTGGTLVTSQVINADLMAKDFHQKQLQRSTSPTTLWGNIKVVMIQCTWSVEFTDIVVSIDLPDSVSNPWIADFSEAS